MTFPAVSDAVEQIAESSPAAAGRSLPRRAWWRYALVQVLPRVVGVLLGLWALAAGVHLRGAAFEQTGDVRFRWDIQNGLNQSARVLGWTGVRQEPGKKIPMEDVLSAWVNTYDRLYAAGKRAGRYGLDYTPARLLVMTLWTREVWAERGTVQAYDDSMAWPLMWLNTGCAAVTAAGMFLLVRALLARPTGPAESGKGLSLRGLWEVHRAWVIAGLAAALVWFNAALLVNAHVFPQWDVWLMPFFMFSCYFAYRRWWIASGLLIALGAMLKGQILMVAPVLAVWALCSAPLWGASRGGAVAGLTAGIGALLRFATGLVVGTVMVVFPWLARDGEVWVWAGLSSAGALAVAGSAWLWWRRGNTSRTRRWLALLLLAISLLAFVLSATYPAVDARVPGGWFGPVVVLLAVWSAGALVWRTGRALPAVLLGCVGFAVLLGGFRYGGSWSWFEIGFRFPTNNYLALSMGTTANLPAILQHRYGVGLLDPVAVPVVGEVTLRTLLRGVYFVLLLPLGVAAARYARTGNPRLMLCLAAPWLLMFAVLPQMHERYLLWAALLSAGGVALGGVRGWAQGAGHLAVTFFALVCVGTQVLNQNDRFWPEAMQTLGPVVPGGGWGVLMLAFVLYAACFVREPGATRPGLPGNRLPTS